MSYVFQYLTFFLNYFIACLYAHHPSTVGFSHLEPNQIPHSAAKIYPTRRPNSDVGIFPSQSQVHNFAGGLNPHSEACVNPTPLLGFPPRGGQKLAGTADGTIPSQKHHCKLTKPSTCQIKYPGAKDKHSKET